MLCGIIHHRDCYNGFYCSRPTSTESAWHGSTSAVDPKRHSEGFCWLHHFVTAATTSVPDAFSGICQLCHGSLQVSFIFRVQPPSDLYILWWCLVWHLLPAFRLPSCSAIGICNTTTLQIIPLASICTSLWWSMAQTRSALSDCIFHCFK